MNKSLLCVCCKSNKSIFRCDECDANEEEDNEEEDGTAVFCGHCVVVIHKNINNKLHSILSIENEKNEKECYRCNNQAAYFCSQCPEDLKYYCMECNTNYIKHKHQCQSSTLLLLSNVHLKL